MLYLYQSNRLEYLASTLTAIYRLPTAAPVWAAEEIVVQSQGMRRYLNQFLAREHGIAANLRYSLPAGFAWRLLRQVLPGTPALNPFSPEVLRWRLLALFQSEAFRQPEFVATRAALADYLHSSANAPYHLAGQLADIFDQYLVYRPDWILAWQNGDTANLGADEHWQAALWRHLAEHGSQSHRVAQWQGLMHNLHAEHLPARLLVFGIAALAPMYLDLLQAAAQHTDVHVFALNPSREYWGNVLPAARLLDLDETDLSASGHPLLASLGKQGRDFFDALAAMPNVHIETPIYDDVPANTLLGHLQADIQNLRLPERSTPLPFDHSIQFAAAHSPLRELQMLKDQLLQDLAAHPEWQPHDIAVLTPHIEPYLPFIEAVFGHSQGGNQALPFSVADVKTRHRQPLMQLLAQWLLLVQSRLEADQLLPLLDSPVLRERFDFSQADVDLIAHAIAEQGIRWGSDEAMRRQYGGHDHAFSWQQGRERTVLGWLLPQTADAQTWQGVLPWYADIGHTPVLARAQHCVDVLIEHYQHWQQPASIEEWAQRIRLWLADMADSDTLGSAAMQQLETALAAWSEQAALAGFNSLLPPYTAIEHIQRFLDSSSEAGFLRSGITFCSMVPMRSLPFKCVCLIGLNDGDYPRTTKAAAFDLIARHPRHGDRARRDDDRYLFLESILSAREKLYLSYIGKDIRKNEALAPSALLNELTDTLAAMTATPTPQFLEQHRCQHPLQAFSQQYFNGSLASTRQDYADALSHPAEVIAPFWPASAEQDNTDTITPNHPLSITQLIAFWRNPVLKWLQQTLQWQPYRPAEAWQAAEPFAVETEAALNQAYVAARRQGQNLDRTDDALRQMNVLPDGLLGHTLGQPWRIAALSLDLALLNSPRVADAEFNFSHHGLILSGSLNQLHRHGQLIDADTKPHAPQTIAHYLQHLIFCAADVPGIEHSTHILYPPAPLQLPPIDAATAQQLLRPWLAWYVPGQQQPLPFFAQTGLAAAQAWYKQDPDSTTPPDSAKQAAHSAYVGNRFKPGQAQRTEVALAFGRHDTLPTDTPLFWQLVADLLLPMIAHTQDAALETDA